MTDQEADSADQASEGLGYSGGVLRDMVEEEKTQSVENDFSDLVGEKGQPKHKTMMEALKYGWGNGERKLMIVSMVLMVLMVVISAGLAYTLAKQVVASGPHPYEVTIPVQVQDRLEGHEGPATNSKSVTLLVEGCNTTDDVLMLSFLGQWIKYSHDVDRPAPEFLVPATLLSGIPVLPGGSLCDDGSQPTITTIPLPTQVVEAGGYWQLFVQVEVRSCKEARFSSELGGETIRCDQPGEVIDHAGWFTERFFVKGGA